VADTNTFPKDNLFYFNRGRSATELISQYLKKDNLQILDVGAGYGHILHNLGQRYPNSTRLAIEFSEVCVKHLKSLGVQTFTQPAEKILPEMKEHFDLVVISHVLEHVLNPREVIQLIHSSLAPGGILYVEVPNIPPESLLKYPDQVWAPRFDEPHISFFSVSTLRSLFESVDLDVDFCETAGPHYQYISRLRFGLPPLRWFTQALLPSSLFHWLRNQRFTESVRVQETNDSFYQYGGFRIWIRGLARKNMR